MSGFITPPTTIVLDDHSQHTGRVLLIDGRLVDFSAYGSLGIATSRVKPGDQIFYEGDLIAGMYHEGDVIGNVPYTLPLPVFPFGSGLHSISCTSLDPDTVVQVSSATDPLGVQFIFLDPVTHTYRYNYHYQFWTNASSL